MRLVRIVAHLIHTHRVSIHAPWEGCDLAGLSARSSFRRFNSRTLGRVPRLRECIRAYTLRFQFTHPGKGATEALFPPMTIGMVSIHAPWEGCDSSPIATTRLLVCFNSRTLGRVRPKRTERIIVVFPFQFTHPGKGATLISFHTFVMLSFNSRTLGRVRPVCPRELLRTTVFQFTHPGKGATFGALDLRR